LLKWSGEVRDHEGRLWRVDTDDTQDTTVYLSAQTGEVLYHRNKTWRLFDVFWMLHIMDYTGRKNFNNPLVVTAAIGGLWLALTGIWLPFASFHWSEFCAAPLASDPRVVGIRSGRGTAAHRTSVGRRQRLRLAGT
jgi:hypothetical protein